MAVENDHLDMRSLSLLGEVPTSNVMTKNDMTALSYAAYYGAYLEMPQLCIVGERFCHPTPRQRWKNTSGLGRPLQSFGHGPSLTGLWYQQ